MITGDDAVETSPEGTSLAPAVIDPAQPPVTSMTTQYNYPQGQGQGTGAGQINQTNIQVRMPAYVPPTSAAEQNAIANIRLAIINMLRFYRLHNMWVVISIVGGWLIVMQYILLQVEGQFLRLLRDVNDIAFLFFIVILPTAVGAFFVIMWRTSNKVSQKYMSKVARKVEAKVKRDRQIQKSVKGDIGKQIQIIMQTMGPGGF